MNRIKQKRKGERKRTVNPLFTDLLNFDKSDWSPYRLIPSRGFPYATTRRSNFKKRLKVNEENIFDGKRNGNLCNEKSSHLNRISRMCFWLIKTKDFEEKME